MGEEGPAQPTVNPELRALGDKGHVGDMRQDLESRKYLFYPVYSDFMVRKYFRMSPSN